MTITENVIGVNLVVDSDQNQFRSNIVTSNTSASLTSGGIIVQTGSDNNLIASNNISPNGDAGVSIQTGSNGNLIRGNTVNNNAGAFSGVGILVVQSQDTSIRGNQVNGNLVGISLSTAATNNIVFNNTANNNRSGIIMLPGSTSNAAVGNTALGNALDLADGNSGCDSNVWANNTFVTDGVAGVPDGGPGAGCIQ